MVSEYRLVRVNQNGVQDTLPKLNLMEKVTLLRGALDPDYFKEHVRPMLYEKCGGDAETVHELVLHLLRTEGYATRFISPFFRPQKNLMIEVNGKDVCPFGTAAGMDKDGEVLTAFGRIYGFQEPGTVVLFERYGDNKIRVAALEEYLDVANAQGFSSKGLEYFLEKISAYRRAGGKAIIYANICGLPLSEKNAVQNAMKEMEILITKLLPYVDGFVWNPASPNIAALKLLRNPIVFHDTAQLMTQLAKDKLRLVKIWTYEPKEKDATFQMIGKFIEEGGHGVVTTNTKMFSKDQLPEHIRDKWGHTSFGRSGAFLRDYRLRSVKDMRIAFPDAIIIGTGGIYTPDDAYDTFRAGANMLEGFTPYAYFGPGLVKNLMKGVSVRMYNDGFQFLGMLQAEVRELAREGRLESFLRKETSIL